MAIRRKNTDIVEMINKGHDTEDADLHYILINTVLNSITLRLAITVQLAKELGGRSEFAKVMDCDQAVPRLM